MHPKGCSKVWSLATVPCPWGGIEPATLTFPKREIPRWPLGPTLRLVCTSRVEQKRHIGVNLCSFQDITYHAESGMSARNEFSHPVCWKCQLPFSHENAFYIILKSQDVWESIAMDYLKRCGGSAHFIDWGERKVGKSTRWETEGLILQANTQVSNFPHSFLSWASVCMDGAGRV